MMAPDSSPPQSRALDDESVAAVRLALQRYLRDTRDPRALQASLLVVASEARARRILPEQLLVTLKDIWSSLPEVRAMTDSGEQVRLLQRVVTMCIREYYNA
ncbi:MAG: hypothetical protein DMD35_01075 [Gemmatimonadetes bacterium]|nr:MAG: hypothetical protein DMD35_01075 [Gemmatimonadota bacterium]